METVCSSDTCMEVTEQQHVNERLTETETFAIQIHQFRKAKLPTSGQGVNFPSARSGHRAIATDDHMWVLGGYNPDHDAQTNAVRETSLFKELWKYNITTNNWVLVPNTEHMPHELASHSAIRHQNHMLVFGGTGFPFGDQSSNRLTACHLHSGQWYAVDCKGSKPEKIYGQAMAVIGSNLYVYGGTTGYIYNTELHELNLHTLNWRKVQPENMTDELPLERYRHEIAFDDDHIYVLGGGTSQSVYSLKDIYVFSIPENVWRLKIAKCDKRLNEYPLPRRCHSCIQLGKNAYICGGYDGEFIIGDLWRLQLDELQWTKLTDMPEPVYFHSSAITTEGCMIVFGGVSCISPTTRTNSCYKVWLEIPSLQTICWQALLHYNPSLLKMSRRQLLNLGLNQAFIDKLPCPEGA
uniref:Kelch domain-containing protein 10 n=1 Tax=Phallusia mammillata TaxID=59560 RepID=A0A6F9DFX5_9ASCI|nr:kelch domain-containing protein 10 [Phallusia mammillata]